MPAYVVGAMMHVVMGIVFALVQAGLYQALDIESGLAGWGLLFGFVHWIVVGMGMGMVGSMHPVMRSGGMQASGLFVKNYLPMTVMGFLMLHLLYGLLVGVLYEAWPLVGAGPALPPQEAMQCYRALGVPPGVASGEAKGTTGLLPGCAYENAIRHPPHVIPSESFLFWKDD